ncbi:MAG: CoF synthetase, partial [Actinobacteria bacterium HGW-Actinobacteria-10]
MSESTLWLLWDAFRARRQGPAAIALRQRARLAEMVAYARANSPYYRELYEGLPDRVEEHAALPVTNKKELMAHFDGWVTDPEVTIEEVRAFIANPDRIGEQFLGKYIVATTTGTTGTPGVFVFEDRHLAAGSATLPLTFWTWLGVRGFLKLLGRGVRIAGLFATGGHFVAVVGSARARR